MSQGWTDVLLLVPIFLFSLCVHEYAHAWTANRRGDATAASLGRLSMHPMAHADLLGTFLLPILCIYNGWAFFGWAKPVPVDMRNFARPRRDMALVAVAGPLSNVVLALVATAALAALVRAPIDSPILRTTQLFCSVAVQVNLMLAVFNLLPLPPLDGFQVLQGVLPSRLALWMDRLVPAAGFLLIALFLSGAFRYIAYPVRIAYRWLMGLALT